MSKRKITLGILFVAVCLIISGCGGGTDSSDMAVVDTGGQTGMLSVAIDWPVNNNVETQNFVSLQNNDKIIPAGTARITLTITGDGMTAPLTDQFTNTSGTIAKQYSIPTGTKTLTLNALDGSNNILAQRIQNVVIEFNKTTTLTASLGSSMKDSGFTPQTITIPKGSSLMWLNNGTTNHTVQSTGSPSFTSSGIIAPNGSWSNTFNTAGIFNYRDSLNTSLTGVVKVFGVESINPSSAYVGNTVTINGGGFGTTQGSSSVKFYNNLTAVASNWNDTRIICTVPADAVTGNVIITVNSTQSNGFNFTVSTLSDGMLAWSFSTGSGYLEFSFPSVASNGTIYFGSRNNRIYAISSNGSFAWSYNTGGQMSNPASIGSNGTIYIVSNSNTIFAANSNGTLAWSLELYGIPNTPAIASNGTIYVGSLNWHKMYAVNTTGAIVWSYNVGDYIEADASISSNGIIYFGSNDNFFYALNPNGTRAWSYYTNSDCNTVPSIGSNGTIYFGSDNKFYALNSSGTYRWSFYVGNANFCSVSIGGDGKFYFTGAVNYIMALNDNRTYAWSYQTGGDSRSYMPILDSAGKIYCGSFDNKLYTLNSNGTLSWSYLFNQQIALGSPAIGANGRLYVIAGDRLYAIVCTNSPASTPWPMFMHDNQHTGRQ